MRTAQDNLRQLSSRFGRRHRLARAVVAVLPAAMAGLSLVAAAVMSYGTHPAWANHHGGLDLILFARRYQWPLAAVALGLCVGVASMVIARKISGWWLIVLAPVLALFVHRFGTDPINRLRIIDGPQLVSVQQAQAFVGDDDEVVGIVLGDQAYAYPYAALFRFPVIIQPQHDQRMILLWSAYANCVRAFRIDPDLKARHLDIVSIPANALLVYNHRLGQFINGVTGRIQLGSGRIGGIPTGFGQQLATQKMAFARWRQMYPATQVMLPPAPDDQPLPTGPIKPAYATAHDAEAAAAPGGGAPNRFVQDRVALVGDEEPVVIRSGMIGPDPIHLSAGKQPVLVFRDSRTGLVRAFERLIKPDLFLHFHINTDRRRPDARWIDAESNSGWTADGVAIDGPEKSTHLAPVFVQDDLYGGVIKYWYPSLHVWAPNTAR